MKKNYEECKKLILYFFVYVAQCSRTWKHVVLKFKYLARTIGLPEDKKKYVLTMEIAVECVDTKDF